MARGTPLVVISGRRGSFRHCNVFSSRNSIRQEVNSMKEKLSEIYWPLRLTYGVVPLLAGLDKYMNILADWQRYMSPVARSLLPMSVETFLHIIGVVEIVVGLAVLLGLTRLGALIVVA